MNILDHASDTILQPYQIVLITHLKFSSLFFSTRFRFAIYLHQNFKFVTLLILVWRHHIYTSPDVEVIVLLVIEHLSAVVCHYTFITIIRILRGFLHATFSLLILSTQTVRCCFGLHMEVLSAKNILRSENTESLNSFTVVWIFSHVIDDRRMKFLRSGSMTSADPNSKFIRLFTFFVTFNWQWTDALILNFEFPRFHFPAFLLRRIHLDGDSIAKLVTWWKYYVGKIQK